MSVTGPNSMYGSEYPRSIESEIKVQVQKKIVMKNSSLTKYLYIRITI